MTICTAVRHTSQGEAPCRQPEHHHGDHIAVLADPDGTLWAASWTGDRAVSLRTITTQTGEAA